MNDYFEVSVLCGTACTEVLWYKGNDFHEAVKAVNEIKAIDSNALIDFWYNDKRIALYN